MARAAIPSSLVQSVRRATAQEDTQETEPDALECGLLLGVNPKDTQDEDAETAIWGLLRSYQRLCVAFASFLHLSQRSQLTTCVASIRQ